MAQFNDVQVSGVLQATQAAFAITAANGLIPTQASAPVVLAADANDDVPLPGLAVPGVMAFVLEAAAAATLTSIASSKPIPAGAMILLINAGPDAVTTTANTGGTEGNRFATAVELQAGTAGWFVYNGTQWLSGAGVAAGPPDHFVFAELGVPVTTARQWTTALAPVGSPPTDWDFITQAYNYPEDEPTIWPVVHLFAGTYDLYTGPNEIYSNSNFQIPSANTDVVDNNQLRAANGRIFFPCVDGGVSYYDPTDRSVKQLPDFTPPVGVIVTTLYSAIYDHTGATLYLGSQAPDGSLPLIVALDPTATVAPTVIGTCGDLTPGNPRYAYYLSRDTGNDWLYVAVGEDGWTLVAIDVTDGSTITLLTTTGPGDQFISLAGSPLGCFATMVSNSVTTTWWVADGAVYDGTLPEPPPGARNTVAYTNPLVDPPQIDWSRGIGKVLWQI